MKNSIIRGTLLLAIAALLAAFSGIAASGQTTPTLLPYQGRVTSGGVNFNGTGNFKFAIVDSLSATTTYWRNDDDGAAGAQAAASGEPAVSVPLTVAKGLYSIVLGDSVAYQNMKAFTPAHFAHPSLYLRVWFDDGAHQGVFQELTPAQRIVASPYIADASVTASKIAPGAVDVSRLAPVSTGQSDAPVGGLAVSAVANFPTKTGAFGPMLVQNAEVFLSVTGRPVEFDLEAVANPTQAGTGAYAPGIYFQAAPQSQTSLNLRFYRAEVDVTTGDDIPGTNTLVRLLPYFLFANVVQGTQVPATPKFYDTGTVGGKKYHYTVTIEGTGVFMDPNYDRLQLSEMTLVAREM